MRLQKYMAKCGVASRRKCEELIQLGVVKVNGQIIRELGYKVNPEIDIVEVKDKRIKLEEEKIYIILNKPEGYVTTVKDQFNRPTVLDLVDNKGFRIYPVGRLDYNTSGLLLLTNDGDLAHRLTHPRHEITKTYIAKLKGIPSEEELETFRNGIEIDGYITAKAYINILQKSRNSSLVKIKIHEGKNRQIRKMCEKIGHPVIKLKRVAIGEIKLGDLKTGEWRYLSKNEIKYLKSM
jgi:23S rRNA pseudouridine2605 synthase